MRIEFSARPNADPLERIVDGFVFLSGGIFQLIERVGMAADAEGFGGKVRLDVIAKGLLDTAVEPLEEQYDADELERAAEILSVATERIGREFFSEQYDDLDEDSAVRLDGGDGAVSPLDLDDEIPWAETA